MKRFALKRSMLLMLMAFSLLSFGCHKKTAVAPVAPAPPPPPPPPPPPAAPTVTLTSNVNAVTRGQGATLTYSSTNATSVTIDQGIGAVQPVANGTRQVTPTANTTYRATANGPGGTASATATINVNAPPLPPAAAPAPRPAAPPPAPGPTLDQIFTSTMLPILFDYDKSNIRTDQESRLLNAAAWLKQNAAVRFTIEGHADERGSQEYNIALGDERAAAVKKFLNGQGVADSRMNTISYGEERPLCRFQTEDCWQMNRRAAFVRVP